MNFSGKVQGPAAPSLSQIQQEQQFQEHAIPGQQRTPVSCYFIWHSVHSTLSCYCRQAILDGLNHHQLPQLPGIKLLRLLLALPVGELLPWHQLVAPVVQHRSGTPFHLLNSLSRLLHLVREEEELVLQHHHTSKQHELQVLVIGLCTCVFLSVFLQWLRQRGRWQQERRSVFFIWRVCLIWS